LARVTRKEARVRELASGSVKRLLWMVDRVVARLTVKLAAMVIVEMKMVQPKQITLCIVIL